MQNGILSRRADLAVWRKLRKMGRLKFGHKKCAVKRKTFFLHIPKCAGTSVWQLLHFLYGPNNVHIVADENQRNQFAQLSAKKRSSFGAIGGHVDLQYFHGIVSNPADYYKFVTFRHPVERVISNYWYARGRNYVPEQSLLEFARSPRQINMQTTVMCGEADPVRAMENLDRYFDDWYMMEDLDRLPQVLCERLGKRPPDFPHENKGQTIDKTAECAATFAEIERMNEADMVFYAMLCDRDSATSVERPAGLQLPA